MHLQSTHAGNLFFTCFSTPTRSKRCPVILSKISLRCPFLVNGFSNVLTDARSMSCTLDALRNAVTSCTGYLSVAESCPHIEFECYPCYSCGPPSLAQRSDSATAMHELCVIQSALRRSELPPHMQPRRSPTVSQLHTVHARSIRKQRCALNCSLAKSMHVFRCLTPSRPSGHRGHQFRRPFALATLQEVATAIASTLFTLSQRAQLESQTRGPSSTLREATWPGHLHDV